MFVIYMLGDSISETGACLSNVLFFALHYIMMCLDLQLNVPLILNDLYLLRYLCKKQLLIGQVFHSRSIQYTTQLCIFLRRIQ